MSASVSTTNSDDQSVIAKKIAKEDPTLKDIMDVLRVIKSDGSQHDKKLDSLNRLFTELCAKYKVLLKTVTHQEEVITDLKSQLANHNVKLIHSSNDSLEAKNIFRLNSVIFTGIKSSPSSKTIDVENEIKDIMEILEIRKYSVKNYDIIPWGSSSYSMKCTFSHPSTCGQILRFSFKLGKGAASKYNVRPDLSPEQRKVRDKLCSLRRDIESSSTNAKCTVKSWRYLAVSHTCGSNIYYEADYFSQPQLINVDFIPVKYRTSSTWLSQRDHDQSNAPVQSQLPRSNNATASSSYNNTQPTPNVSTSKSKTKTRAGDTAIDICASPTSASL